MVGKGTFGTTETMTAIYLESQVRIELDGEKRRQKRKGASKLSRSPGADAEVKMDEGI